jgi:hypothetical protein
VVVPHELAPELDELDVLAIELAHDARAPRLRETTELLSDIDFLHDRSSSPLTSLRFAMKRAQYPECNRGEQLYCSEFHGRVLLAPLWRGGHDRPRMFLRCVKQPTVR